MPSTGPDSSLWLLMPWQGPFTTSKGLSRRKILHSCFLNVPHAAKGPLVLIRDFVVIHLLRIATQHILRKKNEKDKMQYFKNFVF